MRIDTRRHVVLAALKVWDVIVFVLCAAFALGSSGSQVSVLTSPSRYVFWLLASCLAWHYALVHVQVYRSRRLSRTLQTMEILFGVSLGTSCAGGLAVVLSVDAITISVLIDTWALAIALTIVSRLVLQRLLYSLRERGRNLRFAIIIGSGARTRQVVEQLKEPNAGYRLIGYVDDRKDTFLTGTHGLRYLGTLNDLPSALAAQVVDEAFVTLPLRSYYDGISRAIQDCETQGVPVRMPLDIFKPSISAQFVDSLEGTPIVSFEPSPVSLGYLFTKRLIDVVVSAFALVVAVPLFVVVAVMIKMDSPGPAFFVQRRVGLNKRLFPLIKFRTMHVNSEAVMEELTHRNEAGGPVFKIRNDPRVTTVGRFLRRMSIDELPQLINVLLGHMSLVGPRPLPLRDVAGFTVDWQRRRFSVRPGVTCLWQINGRSSISFDQWMELDMLYIDRRSLMLDLKILLQTIPAVLKKTGAY